MIKLNIGAGNTRYPGFTTVDLIPIPGIDIIAAADSLPFEDNSVDEILAEHLIEHLTYYQFNKAITEWHRVLKLGGLLTLECPDLLGICKQFVESNEHGRYQSWKGYWPLQKQMYGHQFGRSEAEILSQVHKSGYTLEHLKLYLEGNGFSNFVSLEPQKAPKDVCVIRISCMKDKSNIHG